MGWKDVCVTHLLVTKLVGKRRYYHTLFTYERFMVKRMQFVAKLLKPLMWSCSSILTDLRMDPSHFLRLQMKFEQWIMSIILTNCVAIATCYFWPCHFSLLWKHISHLLWKTIHGANLKAANSGQLKMLPKFHLSQKQKFCNWLTVIFVQSTHSTNRFGCKFLLLYMSKNRKFNINLLQIT